MALEFNLASGAGALPPLTRAIADDRFVSRRAVLGESSTCENGGDGEEDDRGDPRTYSTALLG